jgi:hypothetical protein
MDGVFSKLKSLDAFPKVNDDFYQRTLSGGVITIISSIMMIALFFSELSAAHCSLPCARPAVIQSAAINNLLGRLCHGVRCGPGLFLTVTKTNELSVDTSRGELLQINVRGRPGPPAGVSLRPALAGGYVPAGGLSGAVLWRPRLCAPA